jgi:hypothetical protein
VRLGAYTNGLTLSPPENLAQVKVDLASTEHGAGEVDWLPENLAQLT